MCYLWIQWSWAKESFPSECLDNTKTHSLVKSKQSKYTQSGYNVCFGKPRPRKQFAIKIFRIPQQQNGLNWCVKNIIISEDTDVLSPIFFKNRFDVHGQCLVPFIKKKVNSYSLLLGQQALIGLQIQNFH